MSSAATAYTWTETTQQDFSDGILEHQLYVSWRDGGAVEFAPRFDLNCDGFIDLCVTDSNRAKVYWGTDSGYHATNRTTYPTEDPADCVGADLDCDGCPELLAPDAATGGLDIYAGTPTGPSPSQVIELPGPGRYGAAALAADFDNNGWLDLSVGGYGYGNETYIYWGSSSGYSTARRISLPGDQPCHNPEAADFDRDGWLDYLQSNDVGPQHVYWNSAAGFSPDNVTALGSPGEPRHHGKSTADLDNDGWLDLVFTSDGGGESWIYWGSESGFLTRTVLNPGTAEGGSAVVDLNDDGFLDIIFAVSYGGPPAIYWGSDSGYSDRDTTRFGAASRYSGVFVADLDGDGSLDIFLNDVGGGSPIYWGPTYTRCTDLPTVGDYFTTYSEAGNQYDRQYREEYTSSVFDAGSTTTWLSVSWDDTTPGGSSGEMAVRTGNSPSPDSSWSGWVSTSRGTPLPESLTSRYLQYRATLRYQSPACLPMLYEVRVEYGEPATLDVGTVSILAPLDTVDSADVITPRALVRNFGSVAAGFPVTLEVGDYSMTLYDTLDAGTSDTVSFPPWTASPVGSLQVICYTWLAGDEVPANDTARALVFVREPQHLDVGAVAIVAPFGFVDSGTIVTPRAVVQNFGDEDAAFPVLMQIGTGYAYLVRESLPGGAVDTVSFPDWIAAPVGTLPVTCFTNLDGDENRSNDTAYETVQVIRPAERDVAVLRILSPPGSVDSGDYLVPSALVTNHGQGVSFPVTLSIGTGYTSTVSMTLEVGETDTARFNGWNARPSGLLGITCYSQLAGDQNTANDTVIDTVYVIPGALHDFAPIAIVAPGLTHVAGDTVFPKAWVRNMGTRTERYAQIRFRIGSSYDRTVNLPSAVRPGDSIEVTVEDYPWVAASGSFTVSCSTMLAGDVRPSNDMLTLTTEVRRRLTLDVKPDYSVEIVGIGRTRGLPFTARIDGDTGDVVALRALDVSPFWTVRFFDPGQNQPLPDTDGDGLPDLSYVAPGSPKEFDVVVGAPSELLGDSTALMPCTVVVRGRAVGHEDVWDDAVLVLVLAPNLDIHNYPNPLASLTHFVISVPDTGMVSLTVYNRAGELVGQVIQDEQFPPSVSHRRWIAENQSGQLLAPGTYHYLLEFTSRGETRAIRKKLVITRE